MIDPEAAAPQTTQDLLRCLADGKHEQVAQQAFRSGQVLALVKDTAAWLAAQVRQAEIRRETCCSQCEAALDPQQRRYRVGDRPACLACCRTHHERHPVMVDAAERAHVSRDYCRAHCSFEGTYRHICGRFQHDGLGAIKPEFVMCHQCGCYLGDNGARIEVDMVSYTKMLCLDCGKLLS